ncbi:ATPase-like protein [Coemansia sp. Benny D115]|nr:ATPase-like protein [Coemansia sp. Benny D115]
MRLVEAEGGRLVIDGIDVSTIGLNDLRSKISIIPQDPVLLKGTICDNLDPAGDYSDDEIWEAINGVKIAGLLDKPTREFVDNPDDTDSESGPWVEGVGLDKWVDENGMNFSVGQRQLLNLCRALLWKHKIVVLDEATANVDSETDQTMQQVIREEFKDFTVLTIAHRLNTIMDSDRVLVIDQGQVAEFDTPENLLANRDSHFTKLIKSMKLNHSQLSGN